MQTPGWFDIVWGLIGLIGLIMTVWKSGKISASKWNLLCVGAWSFTLGVSIAGFAWGHDRCWIPWIAGSAVGVGVLIWRKVKKK